MLLINFISTTLTNILAQNFSVDLIKIQNNIKISIISCQNFRCVIMCISEQTNFFEVINVLSKKNLVKILFFLTICLIKMLDEIRNFAHTNKLRNGGFI